MSSKKEVYITSGEFSGVNFNLIQKEFDKTVKRVYSSYTRDIFLMEYRGYTFNVLPFLLNGSGFYGWRYRNSVDMSVSRHASRLTPYNTKDLESIEGLDWDLFKCLLPCYRDYGIRDISAYLYSIQPNELACCLIGALHKEFYDFIINKEKSYLSFNYKDIANTQAFCYYIGFLWIVKLSPLLNMYLSSLIKRSGMKELIDSFMPEDSIHFKYIKGEYTSKELLDEYIKPRYKDGSSIAVRETLSLATDGAYDGRDISEYEKCCVEDTLSMMISDFNYKFNMNLAYCILYNGSFDNLQGKLEQAENETDRHKSELECSKLRLQAQMKRNSELNMEVQTLTKEVQTLKGVVANFKSDDDLKHEINTLKTTITENDKDIQKLLKETLELKRELSSCKKKLRGISDDNLDNIDVSSEDIQSNNISMEDIVAKIKDKRIAIIGGLHIGSIEERLSQYGLTHVKHYEENISKIGKHDIGVVMSSVVKHTDVFKFEKECKRYNTQIIYFTGTNIERMLMEIYDVLGLDDN